MTSFGKAHNSLFKIVNIVPKKLGPINITHKSIKGKNCLIGTCEKGESALLFVEMPNDEYWHRIITSEVIDYTLNKGRLYIETANTLYILEVNPKNKVEFKTR